MPVRLRLSRVRHERRRAGASPAPRDGRGYPERGDRRAGAVGVESPRLALVGWGLGGGLVVQAAAGDDRVRAVAVLNGLGDAGRVVRDGVTYPAWIALQERIQEDRRQRTLTGRSTRVPWREIILPGAPIGKEDRHFEADVREIGQAIIEEMTLASAEAYCAFRPESVSHRISPRPLLILDFAGVAPCSPGPWQRPSRGGSPRTRRLGSRSGASAPRRPRPTPHRAVRAWRASASTPTWRCPRIAGIASNTSPAICSARPWRWSA